MSKSAAERQKEFRERQKLHSQKQSVCFLLDSELVGFVTSNAKQQGFSQSDFINHALKEVVTKQDSSNHAPCSVTSNDAEIEILKAEIERLKRLNELDSNEFDMVTDKATYQAEKMAAEIQFLAQNLINAYDLIKTECKSTKLRAKFNLEFSRAVGRALLDKRDFSNTVTSNDADLQAEIDSLNTENIRLTEKNRRLRAADKDLLKRYDAIHAANEKYKKQFEFLSRYIKEQYKDNLSQILDSWFTE